MNEALERHLSDWNYATADLKYGVQRVFHDVFVLASEGKTHLVYGQDYNAGFPCLVNTVGSMLTTGGGAGIPMANFSKVVSLFDRINSELAKQGVNETAGQVSPMAAEIFLHHFAPLKEPAIADAVNEATKTEEFAQALPYREPTDDEIARDLIEAFMTEAPEGPHVESLSREFTDKDALAVIRHTPKSG